MKNIADKAVFTLTAIKQVAGLVDHKAVGCHKTNSALTAANKFFHSFLRSSLFTFAAITVRCDVVRLIREVAERGVCCSGSAMHMACS